MPYVYIPLPADHALAPAFEKRYFPTGRPLQEVCSENPGWEASMPEGVAVYRDGQLIQRGPQKPARKAKEGDNDGA